MDTGTPPPRSREDLRQAALDAARRERDRFKSDVNLIAYAASRGYESFAAKTTRNFPALRHPKSHHKIVVGKGQDGHWLFYTLGDATGPRGTIIDFIQHLDDCPLKSVLEQLRQWTNTPREIPTYARLSIEHVPKDRAAVAATVDHAISVQTHRYLESRGLTRATLAHPRFRSTWRQSGPRRDERDLPTGTALFLHHDEEGLCGFETKSWRMTGFARGGTKALWCSGNMPTDMRLVVAESAIDALSYHEVNPHPRTRYVSFAGAMSARQPELLERAISWLPASSIVVAATDRDAAGDAFAARIAELCGKHPHVAYERHAPTLGKDWNDHLQALRAPERKTPAIAR